MDWRISSLSKPEIKATITVEGGHDPTGDTVQVAVVPAVPGQNPTAWSAASWVTENSIYKVKFLVGPGSDVGALSPGRYQVWVKITDNPEVPVDVATDTLTVF